MSRAFLVVMDSVGCGGAPDAAAFGDAGANTLAHIDAARPLHLPNLNGLGLSSAVTLASGAALSGAVASPWGRWGAATEVSMGKDTPSGHWELAGVPVPWDWHIFPDTHPAFPGDLSSLVCSVAGTGGLLGNRRSSGTVILEQEGARHLQTGWPICYTSADSVFQIAAHEQSFGLDRLLRLCSDIAPTLHAMRVGRVIARPFTGSPATGFTRTANRRDYAIAPPAPTLCDRVQQSGRHVYAIGKIGDIFSMHGIDEVRKGPDTLLMSHLSDLVGTAVDGSLTFANFVEFDSLYGHRRDVAGYAAALEWFDAAIGPVLAKLRDGDLLILTADHGNDPTWHGTDHTRERVPVLVAGAGAGPLGHVGFADVAATIAAHLDLPSHGTARSFL